MVEHLALFHVHVVSPENAPPSEEQAALALAGLPPKFAAHVSSLPAGQGHPTASLTFQWHDEKGATLYSHTKTP